MSSLLCDEVNWGVVAVVVSWGEVEDAAPDRAVRVFLVKGFELVRTEFEFLSAGKEVSKIVFDAFNEQAVIGMDLGDGEDF
jgi:hypothetical protein